MLIEIETGIIALFDEKVLLPMRKMAVGKGDGKGPKNISIPRVVVGIQRGTAEKQTQVVYKLTPRIFVYIEFASLRDEEARRRGAYPIVEAAISYLIDQTLGLNISGLKFLGFQNTTTQEDAEVGIANFTVEFSTSFTFRKLPDAEADDLITLGLEYFLRAGDEVADLAGSVDLEA